jgi:hypothetical protein
LISWYIDYAIIFVAVIYCHADDYWYYIDIH